MINKKGWISLFYIEKLFLFFIFYSTIGWCIETIGELIKSKKFVNRGFLIGPYCPIYGTGVVLITLLLTHYENDLIALFFLSAILCGTLEYITSYLMEKIFKSRWWDYSNMKFNINGRICLETLLLFALAGIFIVKFANPLLTGFIEQIPPLAVHIFCGILFALFTIDCISSLKIMNSIKSIRISVSNQVKDNTEDISNKVRDILMKKSAPYRRILAAFPQAFANKIRESKEKIEKTAEKVKSDLQVAKEKTKDNIQNVTSKAKDSIQNVTLKAKDSIQNVTSKAKDTIQTATNKTINNLQNTIVKTKEEKQKTDSIIQENNKKKYLKNYKGKLSLMNIYSSKNKPQKK